MLRSPKLYQNRLVQSNPEEEEKKIHSQRYPDQSYQRATGAFQKVTERVYVDIDLSQKILSIDTSGLSAYIPTNDITLGEVQ